MSIASRITSIENHIEEAYTEIARLGVDLTNVDKNIDNIADKLQDVYADLPKVTGEGSSLSLTPTRKGGLSIIPKGACEQDSLPSEYQAVEYLESSGTQYIDTGVTLFEGLFYDITFQHNSSGGLYGRFVGTNDNKVISQLSDGKITIGYGSGATSSSTYMVYIFSTYAFGKHNVKIMNNKIYVDGSMVLEKATAKLTNDNEPFYLFRQSGIYGNGRIYSAKLYNQDTLIRNFVPCYRKNDSVAGMYDLVNSVFYTNQGSGTFVVGSNANIPNPDCPQDIRVVTGDNNVVVQNKNLFDKSKMTNEAIIRATGEAVGWNSSRASDYIEINTSNNYYLNIVVFASDSYGFAFYDKNKTFISGITARNLIDNIPSNAKYFRFCFRIDGGYPTNPDEVQFEIGTTATTYVAHAEQTYILHLGTNYLAGIGDYKDKIIGKTDDWKIRRKSHRVNVKDLSWTISSQPDDTSLIMFLCTQLTDRKDSNSLTPLCNYLSYKGIANSSSNGKNKGIGFWFLYNSETHSKSTFIIVPKTIASNATELINWANTNNVVLYYELTTPTEESITNQTLITDLNNMYQAMGYDGTTNMTITSSNAQMTASVSALKGE